MSERPLRRVSRVASAMLAVACVLAAPATAVAERELCARGAKFRGATIDLDLKDADIHDVFRLLSEVGHINLVVADDVRGKVTLRLKRVPWDQVACTVAALHKLTIRVQDRVLLVQPDRRAAAQR